KKSLLTGHIVGVEALARWNDPQFGFMMPGSFMSAIRFHGLDHALLVRMMEDAMSAHLAWRSAGHVVPVSVNLPVPLLDDIGL
ncbi:EAL domain-containing protein, partial [Klebsiella pneumoniae]